MKTKIYLILVLAAVLILSACSPVAKSLTEADQLSVTVNVRGIAQSFSSREVTAVQPGTDVPMAGISPAYTELTLEGYPVAKHQNLPQIFVYPLKDLSISEAFQKAADDLKSLVNSQQPGEKLPYLPFRSDVQMLHAQVSFIAFKSGTGVRYVTEFSSGLIPVNNRGLVYTYQGLTSDGKYYVAAALPVNLPSLPADESSPTDPPIPVGGDYIKYLGDMAAMLDQQSADAFMPDLAKLDALVQSIEIK